MNIEITKEDSFLLQCALSDLAVKVDNQERHYKFSNDLVLMREMSNRAYRCRMLILELQDKNKH